MLKSRIESKSGNNKSWKASPELFDGTIRSSGTDDRPSTGLCPVADHKGHPVFCLVYDRKVLISALRPKETALEAAETFRLSE